MKKSFAYLSTLFLGLLFVGFLPVACSPATTSETVVSDGSTSTDGGEKTVRDSAPDTSNPKEVVSDAGNKETDPGDATPSDGDVAEKTPDTTKRKTVFGGKRPVTIKVPHDYDHKTPHTLLLVLHGYGANGDIQASYLGLLSLLKQKVLILAPDGTVDSSGKQFWNATDACCNFENKPVDDVKYLMGLLEEVKKEYNVDPKKVFVIGHSNGGFMSYRLACTNADKISGIISIAGAMFSKPEMCKPSKPVNILQIHGTNDTTIQYQGGKLGGILAYPGAKRTVETWAKDYKQCAGGLSSDSSAKVDVDSQLAGKDTAQQQYIRCISGGDVQLWTIQKGAHIPRFGENFSGLILDWMKNHARK